jgi:hypothetical protein
MEEPEYQCYTADMVLLDNIISLLLDCLEHLFVVDDLEPLLQQLPFLKKHHHNILLAKLVDMRVHFDGLQQKPNAHQQSGITWSFSPGRYSNWKHKTVRDMMYV